MLLAVVGSPISDSLRTCSGHARQHEMYRHGEEDTREAEVHGIDPRDGQPEVLTTS